MRGTFFLAGTEVVLTTKEEAWYQGDQCHTTLTIVDGPQGQGKEKGEFTFGLYHCDLRKLKKKDPSCLKAIETHSFSELKAENEVVFSISEQAPISDGATGLCLFVGNPQEPFKGGILQLTVHPWKPITEILGLFENFERFKVKSIKNKANKLSIALVPPGSKELGNIDGLSLLAQRKEDHALDLEFEFKIKKLAYDGGLVQAKTEKLKIKKTLGKKDIFSFGDALNQDGLLKFFREVLKETPLIGGRES